MVIASVIMVLVGREDGFRTTFDLPFFQNSLGHFEITRVDDEFKHRVVP